MLTAAELDRLEVACRAVSPARSTYLATDLVTALLETVVDYQQHTTTVERAMEHFALRHGDEVRTLDDLEEVLARFPDDPDGNRAVAMYLWGYQLWTRAEQLRGLVGFIRSRGITDLEALRAWAASSRFEDFRGRVRGLGPAVYQWLVMRLGVETVKPDVRLTRFVASAAGRPVTERETIDGVEQVARRLGIKANELDWAIWEHSG